MRNINKAFQTDFASQNDEWFSSQLLEWYQFNKRELPWRDTKDPFKVWMSEIILQQTRVIQGLPYYLNFVSTFETVEDLASADLDEILKLWQGLGYYSRARNMHICAQTIVDKYNGSFPNNYKELLNLKGIGRYTAAAIASICFDEPVPSVDGNVFRVLSRVFGIHEDIAKSSNFKVFFDKAKELIAKENPGDFNQAVMEFGATVCVPRSPQCGDCMFSSTCFANRQQMIDVLPVKSKSIKVKHRYFNYQVFTFEHQVLIRQRAQSDIWQGLFEFDLQETEKSLKCGNFENANWKYSSSEIVHQLTHQKLHIKFHVFESTGKGAYERLGRNNQMKSVPIDSLNQYAVPKPIELFLNNEFCK